MPEACYWSSPFFGWSKRRGYPWNQKNITLIPCRCPSYGWAASWADSLLVWRMGCSRPTYRVLSLLDLHYYMSPCFCFFFLVLFYIFFPCSLSSPNTSLEQTKSLNTYAKPTDPSRSAIPRRIRLIHRILLVQTTLPILRARGLKRLNEHIAEIS